MLTKEELKDGLKKYNVFDLLKGKEPEKDQKTSKKSMKKPANDGKSAKEAEDEFDEIIRILDADQDGKIDYNDFLQATICAQSNLNETTIREMFNMFDIDKDGTINKNELQQIFSKEKVGIFKSLSAGPSDNGQDDEGAKIIMEIMAEVDRNNDDIITYEEFNAALTKQLKDGIKKQ